MPQYANFDHFVRDLFLCSTNSSLLICENKFIPVPFLNFATGALDYFTDGHSGFFRGIFDRDAEYLDLRSDEQFLKFTIPRCIKLKSNERYFYSLMLVASFLQEFLRFLKDTRYCYRFCFTAYKCFLAVFKREFESEFEAYGGLEGLGKFFQETVDSVDCLGKYERLPNSKVVHVLNNDDPGLIETVVLLIERCGDVPDENFELNDYELSLLTDNDIDEVLQSMEHDANGEDPLHLQWPPPNEEIREISKAVREAHDKKPNLIDGSDSDGSEEEEEIFSDLKIYISVLECEAQEQLGHQVFIEKKLIRMCPCCGIECFQFSLELYLKQLGPVLVEKSDSGNSS